jgi:hypothetical protein
LTSRVIGSALVRDFLDIARIEGRREAETKREPGTGNREQ